LSAVRLAAVTPARFHGRLGRLWLVVVATVRMAVLRHTAYAINVVRWPLFPLGFFAVSWLAWGAAGQNTVGGVDRTSFLLLGIVGMMTWTGSVWGIGHAIQDDRYEGTIGAIFLAPASRLALLLGHGLAQVLILLPSVVVLGALGLALGARFTVASPMALVLAVLALVVSSLGTGILLAAVFVLSRRANLLANAIQHPVHLLGGFMVPRADLPGWLGTVSGVLPVAHAVDALRAAALHGASLTVVLPMVGMALFLSFAAAMLGALGLRRVEHAAKRSGQLELY
jgi:ABC-2 type transport system permease protein